MNLITLPKKNLTTDEHGSEREPKTFETQRNGVSGGKEKNLPRMNTDSTDVKIRLAASSGL
jgi:hypothetical protein